MAAAGVLVAVLAVVAAVESRAVNISNTWVLPEDGFPVFYRYFRDRINWFEADAVCQFHHANLVTVDTGAQFDAARAFLKELDVLSPVWLGLKRGRDQPHFLWTSEQPLSGAGYWSEPLPTSSEELCAAADPAADFRWHGLSCGGLEVASFICELPVPDWAAARDGCMVENLPSLTAAFLPEEAAVELTSDCGLGGTRRVVCKGNTTREALYAQLNCHNMMNEDATLGPGSGSGMPPGSAQDAEQADPADQSEQPEPEADDAYTSTGTSTETSASTTPGDQTSTRQRRATTSASSAAREVTTDVSVDTSVPASSTENPSEPSTIAETVTTGPASPASAAPSSPAASSAVSSAVPATKAAVPSEAATPGPATTTSSPASSPAPGHPGTLIVARKDDQKEAAPAAASTAAPQAQAPAWTPEDKPIIVPIVAKKGPSFPKKVTAAGAKPFRPEKIPLKLRAPTAAPARTDDTAAPAPAAASTPRHDATSVAEAMDAADKISATAGVVPEQDKRAAQVPQLSAVADVIKLPATVNTDSDNKLEDTEFTNHMAGDAADDLDDALMIRELSSARTPLIKSVPVVDVPLDEPRTAAATAQPAAAETAAAATSTPVTATATKLSKESAVFLSLPVEGRVARRPPVKKDGLPAAIAGAAVTTTSTTTTTTTTPAPPSTAAPAATTADPNATTASPIRLRESMAGPGGKARTLTTAPPAPAEPGASTTTSTTTPAPTTSTSSTAAPTTTTASTTTAAAAQNASTAAPQHATDAPTTTAAPASTARPEPANGEAPKERRRQHLPAPLLSMNMKPDSEDGEDGLESEPQSPPRPNRSRSLVSHQHRTFYPYFLNRVLGR